jgi:hypothetical protein
VQQRSRVAGLESPQREASFRGFFVLLRYSSSALLNYYVYFIVMLLSSQCRGQYPLPIIDNGIYFNNIWNK